MSAPVRDHDTDGRVLPVPSMYAPPWARDAAPDAAETALAAAEKLRSALPPAPLLTETEARPRRRERAFDGDIAIQHLQRSSLDPVAVPAPPLRAPRSGVGVLARFFGAAGVAALAAFFMVGTAPFSLAVKGDDEATPTSFWSRFVFPTGARPQQASSPLADVVALAAPQPVKTVAVLPAVPPLATPAIAETRPEPIVPAVRPLAREEIALLYKRGEELIRQGDVAAARLMFARAAEAGDARAALALGAAFDPDVLKKLGVLGVAPDAAQAREWYQKAAQFGSGEASRRIELLAQGR